MSNFYGGYGGYGGFSSFGFPFLGGFLGGLLGNVIYPNNFGVPYYYPPYPYYNYPYYPRRRHHRYY